MSTTRFTIDLAPQLDAVLTSLAKSKGVTKAEVIRRALATYSFLADNSSDQTVTMVDRRDQGKRLVAIP